MDIIGKTTIHPIFFYSGKISGYLTWIVMILLFFNLNVVEKHPFQFSGTITFCLLF